MVEEDFMACARMIGVERRIAELILDCDRAIAEQPATGEARWLGRLEDQRRRLAAPDLRTIVAVTARLAEETPSLAPFVALALRPLVAERPELRPFLQRLTPPAEEVAAPHRDVAKSPANGRV